MQTGKKPESRLRINRRVWIIRDLLNKPLRQKDILDLWRKRGRIQYEEIKKLASKGMAGAVETPNGPRPAKLKDIKIFKPEKFKDGIGIPKGSMTKLFKGDYINKHIGLIEEKIVENKFINGNKGYRLVESPECLLKILTEFNNPALSNQFRKDLKTDFMNSEFAKKLINLELVDKLESELSLNLNVKDRNFILILLRIFPSALLKSLEDLYNQDKFKPYALVKNKERSFLMDLQFQAYSDVNYQYGTEETMIFNTPYPVDIEFEIKTSLKTKKENFKQVNSIQRTSLSLLSVEEKNKMMAETEKFMTSNIYSEIANEIPDLFNETIDKRFDLYDSPLSYEKNQN
jgi:hypothetical protein